MKRRSMTIVLVLILYISISFSVALAKAGDSIDEAYNANALSNATHPVADLDTNAAFDPGTLGYIEQDDYRGIDTTNADPNFDPLSSFDAEILDALRNADPKTRIDYDAATGTITIPDQDAISEASTLQTDGYMPESSTLGYIEQDDYRGIDTTNADPNFDPLSSFDAEILDALRDADPETRIDYDAATGTVTIPDQDAISEAPILQDGRIHAWIL